MENSVYLGDAVYASFDGFQIWLQTGSHNRDEASNRIALDPATFANLIDYAQRMKLIKNIDDREQDVYEPE